MTLKRTLSRFAYALPMLALLAGPADAHRRWLMPSATVLSGETEIVSVDAAASNELFVFDHRPLSLDDLIVVGPDGKAVATKVIGSGAYRSAFDVPLAAQGTYRIALASHGMVGSYMLNGERKRFRGASAADVPAGATEVQIAPMASRTETFATLGAPNSTALQPTGIGLEMVPVTHPNDLVTGEAATMKFLMNGKPAADLEIEFVAGGTRYRDNAGIKTLKTDADGMVTLQVETAGLYYLEIASGGGGRPQPGEAPTERASYTVVLEFLPG